MIAKILNPIVSRDLSLGDSKRPTAYQGINTPAKIICQDPVPPFQCFNGESTRVQRDAKAYLLIVLLFFLDPNSPCKKIIGRSSRIVSSGGV